MARQEMGHFIVLERNVAGSSALYAVRRAHVMVLRGGRRLGRYDGAHCGVRAPAGKPETNWIKTIPGKGWFTYFRLYGPTQPYFDRSWVLPDIELIK